jgi:uncharacterized protein
MLSIKFSDAAAVLASANSTVTIAEAHGCLCGALCVSNHYSFARWFDELSDELSEDTDQPSGEELRAAKELLQTLYKETVRALRGDEMEFAPLLPDDDTPLARRAEALAQWCQGFLYGFGSVAGTQRNFPAEVEEVLRDLSQIARAAAGDSEPTDDDESDYVEIVEYVRVGAQLVHDELRPEQ